MHESFEQLRRLQVDIDLKYQLILYKLNIYLWYNTCWWSLGSLWGYTLRTSKPASLKHCSLPRDIKVLYHWLEQGCGNIEPTTEHFYLFSLHLSYSPYVLYTVWFQSTGYSLDLWDNVLYDWLFPHHWVGGRYLTYTVLVNSDKSNLYLLVDSLHSCSMIHVSILIGLKLCSARKCMVYQTKYLYQT